MFQTSSCAFGRPKQPSGSELRERTGQATRRKVKDSVGYMTEISDSEKQLLTRIAIASEKRDWDKVQSHFATYTGTATPIYNAVMNAALRCRRYREGASTYEKCRETCDDLTEQTFNAALKIFGKLGKSERVCEIWEQARKECELSYMLVASRIHAAADGGDVETAAAMLDLLITNKLEVNALVITSAIRSCWGWGPNQHRAAKYFWDLFSKLDVKPDIVAITALMGACVTAPLEDVLSAKAEMTALKIQPNRVFAETYVTSLLQQRFKHLTGPAAIADALRDKPANRLQAARVALTDFETAGVEVTGLCKILNKALLLLKQSK